MVPDEAAHCKSDSCQAGLTSLCRRFTELKRSPALEAGGITQCCLD